MPYRDRTGPVGRGPRSGRGMGDCAGRDYADRPYEFRHGQHDRHGAWRRQRGQGYAWRKHRWSRFEAVPQGDDPAKHDFSWMQQQLNELQAAIQKLTERLDAKA